MNYFLTGDEHFSHGNCIQYANRPFASVEEMDYELIYRHNERVRSDKDVVIHCGDFTLGKNINKINDILEQLNGQHIFIKGGHDHWMDKAIWNNPRYKNAGYMWEKNINGTYVVACHYAMRTFQKQRYGAYQAYGHSHNRLKPIGRQLDVGVDCHNYYPISIDTFLLRIKENENEPITVDDYEEKNSLAISDNFCILKPVQRSLNHVEEMPIFNENEDKEVRQRLDNLRIRPRKTN